MQKMHDAELGWKSIYEQIKRLPSSEWRDEISKIEEGESFPGFSKQTIKEKVTIELTLEYKRRRV